MPRFQTKALVVVIILDLSHPIVWLVRHMCSDKAVFSFLQKETTFFTLFQMCTKLTFGLSNILMITVMKALNRSVETSGL